MRLAGHDIAFNGCVQSIHVMPDGHDAHLRLADTTWAGEDQFLPCLAHVTLISGFDSDWLVGNATAQSSIIPTANLTNGTTFSGQTSYGGWTYSTDALYLSGILSNSTTGLNHAATVGGNGVEALDGFVAVLTVKVVASPSASASCVPHLSTSCAHLHRLIDLSDAQWRAPVNIHRAVVVSWRDVAPHLVDAIGVPTAINIRIDHLPSNPMFKLYIRSHFHAVALGAHPTKADGYVHHPPAFSDLSSYLLSPRSVSR